MDSQLNTDVVREDHAQDKTLGALSERTVLIPGLAFVTLMQDHFQELWSYLE